MILKLSNEPDLYKKTISFGYDVNLVVNMGIMMLIVALFKMFVEMLLVMLTVNVECKLQDETLSLLVKLLWFIHDLNVMNNAMDTLI